MDKATWRVGATVAAIAGLALTACSERMQEPPQPDQFCPKIYQPVCARTAGGNQTFPNACEASAAGYSAYSPGACEQSRPDRVCPQVYMPVCAVRAGQYKTYSNDCVAGGDGARVVHPGAC